MKSVQWMITRRCNFRCRHCYLGESPSTEPDTAELIAVMDRMKSEGIEQVILTGGEPLVRQDIQTLFEELTQRGITIERIITNGSLISRALLDYLRQMGQTPVFNISYDGDNGQHNRLRNRDNFEPQTLKAFDMCRKSGFATATDMTLDADNIAELRDSIRTLDSHGCGQIKAVPMFPLGNAQKHDLRCLSPKDFLEAVCEYIPHYYADAIRAEIFLYYYFFSQGYQNGWTIPALMLDKCQNPLSVSRCGNDSTAPFLTADGRLLNCPGMAAFEELSEQFKHVSDVGFEEAKKSEGFTYLTEYTVQKHLKHNPDCEDCPHKLRCGGGCRVSAMAFGNGIDGIDPFICGFFRQNGPKRIRDAVYEAQYKSLFVSDKK